MEDIREPVEKMLDYLEMRMVKKRNISFIETPFCLTDPYYWKYFNNASNGLDRMLAKLNNVSIILGIEEPETNLHPQAQKKFIASLKDKRQDCER